VDLTLLDRQVDMIVRDDAGEPFRDRAQIEPHPRASWDAV
jgi:hypothetical protein